MLLLWILVLVAGIAYLAHRRTAPLPALGVVAVYLLAMGVWSHAPGWLLLIFWVLLAVVAAPLLVPDLRRQWRLRTAGHGGCDRPARSALRHGRG